MREDPYEGLNWDQRMARIRRDNQRFVEECNKRGVQNLSRDEYNRYMRIKTGDPGWGRRGY